MNAMSDTIDGDDTAMERRLADLLATAVSAAPVESEPPADLWDRISAALRSDDGAATVPAEAPGQLRHVDDVDAHTVGAGTIVEYVIDAHDVVVGTGGDWDGFAADNEAPELSGAGTGARLWDVIADEALRDLWREAVARVRATGRQATLPFRCDGPSVRRWYEMTLTPGPDGTVAFRSALTFEMARPEVRALRRYGDRDTEAPVVRICSWCGHGDDDGTWRPVEELLAGARLLEQDPPPPVVHGICPSCVDQMTRVLTDV